MTLSHPYIIIFPVSQFMEKYLCIHCHFYQPPRENPWLEEIEVQDLAGPYHDWNERINAECYAPNSSSRILNEENKIVDIVNNYLNMSFNFGPTLLSWIKTKDSATYHKILEADRESLTSRSGHGNAIAQVYNHIIMPLAEPRDQITQVIWGIEDFKSHFKREPEGMWLAETACNTEVLEVLADHNIKYTILSPYQAKEICLLENHEEWVDANHGQIDPSQGYLCRLSHDKSITIFFYDALISQAVAFENLLKDGSQFAKRLLDGYSENRPHHQLLHIATDGETYGHHFKFGEMAMTYAINDLEKNHHVTITNYGEYLGNHPPEYEVRIHENSSWSCSHGVERWKEDCGCRIGYPKGWNQKWRRPLRESLKDLKEQLNEIYTKEGHKLLTSPWEARNDYIRVVLDRNPETIDPFFKRHQKKELDHEDQVKCLKLLELQRQAMLMFTSCGWFFDDISGVETVQILKHACRAIQIAHQLGYELENDFLDGLSKAHSNHSDYTDGRDIYIKLAKTSEVDLKRAIAHYAIVSLLPNNNTKDLPLEEHVYSYTIKQIDCERVHHKHSSLAVGQIRVTSNMTLESEEAVIVSLHLGSRDFQCKIGGLLSLPEYQNMKLDLMETFDQESLTQVVRKLDSYFPGDFHSLKDLFVEERRKILAHISEDIISPFQDSYFTLYLDNKRLMEYHHELDVPIHREFQKAARFVLSKKLEEMIVEEGQVEGERHYSEGITGIICEARKWQIQLDQNPSESILNNLLNARMEQLKEEGGKLILLDILRLLQIAEDIGLKISFWSLQNNYFSIRSDLRHNHQESIGLIEDLERHLNIDIPSGQR